MDSPGSAQAGKEAWLESGRAVNKGITNTGRPAPDRVKDHIPDEIYAALTTVSSIIVNPCNTTTLPSSVDPVLLSLALNFNYGKKSDPLRYANGDREVDRLGQPVLCQGDWHPNEPRRLRTGTPTVPVAKRKRGLEDSDIEDADFVEGKEKEEEDEGLSDVQDDVFVERDGDAEIPTHAQIPNGEEGMVIRERLIRANSGKATFYLLGIFNNVPEHIIRFNARHNNIVTPMRYI
ncbi:hypothetical protein HDU98_011641 [Podochytrium sp. JEL0797]|nr:hypothetical protein HDU98_011641 [Podochytrium sp. JEL0797]